MKKYDEIAKTIFKRRDEYIKKQKKNKKIIISSVAAAVCCCIVITVGFSILNNGILKNNIPTIDNSQTSNNGYSSTDITTSENFPSQNDTTTSENSSTSNEVVSDETSSYIPPVTEPSGFMDSIDKINFYSAKKIISDYSLLPTGKSPTPKAICLNNIYVEYPIDRDEVFTISMVTYFTIILNDEKGFLAQKLGGTGLVEVVVTENDIEDIGQMITFKKDDNYYTCLLNGRSHDAESNTSERRFSTHKYIEGFNLVKNLQQENYKFIVHYDGLKVTGFESYPFKSTPSQYKVDDITFVEDFCVVIFTNQNFTIDMLETFFKDEEEFL